MYKLPIPGADLPVLLPNIRSINTVASHPFLEPTGTKQRTIVLYIYTYIHIHIYTYTHTHIYTHRTIVLCLVPVGSKMDVKQLSLCFGYWAGEQANQLQLSANCKLRYSGYISFVIPHLMPLFRSFVTGSDKSD